MKFPNLNAIGLMSGTSLDGLDIALVEFNASNKLNYHVLASQTIGYNLEWKSKLEHAFHCNESELKALDLEYGIWLGSRVNEFIKNNPYKVDLISSHGHTVFHQPKNKISIQIGNGYEIFKQTNIPVVNNFRQQDVLLGGQGAPLVPMGDELLFPAYTFCLNLGGFSNISWNDSKLRKACDLSPCNILLNTICRRLKLNFDDKGMLASNGKINSELLAKWNAIPFYMQAPPKSLGREWFELNFLADIFNESYPVEDLLATAVQHITYQINLFIQNTGKKFIATALPSQKLTCLVTGGGVYNQFLMAQLNENAQTGIQFIIPEPELVDFKEAILFALLGYLRWNNEINVLASVTGALRDHSSGTIYAN